MATPNIVPRSDSEGGIGTASKYWASAYIDNVFVSKIGRDADNLIDFSVDNNITFRINTNNELTLDSGQLYPVTNNGLGLGAPGHSFADLYLASGAVINFDNGDIALTHGGNTLEFTGGLMRFTDDQKLTFGNGNDLQIFHEAGSTSKIENYTGNLTIQQRADDASIVFQCDDGSGGLTEYFKIDGNAQNMLASKNVRFLDGKSVKLGTGGDAAIQHDGTDTFIENYNGNFIISNQADDKNIVFKSDDGFGGVATYFQLDGANVRTTFAKPARFLDNVILQIGDGADLRLEHTGSHSNIYNNTGNLSIINYADDKDILFQSDDGAGAITTYFYLDGSSATHDGSATTMLTTNWPDKSHITLGTSHDFHMYHTGSQTVISQQGAGNLTIQNTVNDASIVFGCDDGSGGTTPYLTLDGSATTVEIAKATNLAGNLTITGGSDIFLADNGKTHYGASNDLEVYHDGSNSYVVSKGTGDLILEQQRDDGDIVFKSDDGSGGTQIYFMLDGSTKLLSTKVNNRFDDNVKLEIGTSGDLDIYHDGTDSYIHNDTGDLRIENDATDGDIVFRSDDGSGGLSTYFRVDGGLGATIFPDNKSLGFGSIGDMYISHDGTNTKIENFTGHLSINNKSDDKDIIFSSDDGSGGLAEYFRLDGGDVKTIFSQPIHLLDNKKLILGTGTDLEIHHDSTNSNITNKTGTLFINQDVNDGDIIFRSDDGTGGVAEYFRVDGAEEKTIFSKPIRINDNVRLNFGDQDDLVLRHNGTDAFITNGTGDLKISNNADNKDIIFQSDDGSGGVTTYLTIDGSATLVTLSQEMRFFDNIKLTAGSSGDLQIHHDTNDSRITNDTGHLFIQQNADNKDIVFRSDDSVGGTMEYFRVDGGMEYTVFSRHARFIDNMKVLLGNGDDLQIFHDGTDSFIANLVGDLKISNSKDDGDILFQTDNGSGGVTTYIQLDGSEVSTKILTQKVMMPNLPTSDPGNSGQLWNDNGTLKISVG